MSGENEERKLMKPAASFFTSFYDLPTVGGFFFPLDLNFIILFFDVFAFGEIITILVSVLTYEPCAFYVITCNPRPH